MENITLTVDRPAYGGLSIGRYEGKVVMIRGAVLPGETIEVNVEKDKKEINYRKKKQCKVQLMTQKIHLYPNTMETAT